MGLIDKIKFLSRRGSVALLPGQRPLQDLKKVVDRRNELIHSKPMEQAVDFNAPWRPGRMLSEEARFSCLTIREVLIALAASLSMSAPGYLSYCPPGDFRDEVSWAKATVLTGVRDDPDFPPLRSEDGPDSDDVDSTSQKTWRRDSSLGAENSGGDSNSRPLPCEGSPAFWGFGQVKMRI